ncbi:Uncharacterised protein [Helicobacter canis]|uniref:Uncharacterized protein n=2 Tax=Helicobacter canis TaxID=29419 RepID=A0A377JLS0_9HELI|nr:Uncharacterised protein [Helicobacter canis]
MKLFYRHCEPTCRRGQSTQTKTQNLESTFDKNAKNIQTLQKADSSPNAHFSVIASRDSGVAIHKGAKVDSSQ